MFASTFVQSQWCNTPTQFHKSIINALLHITGSNQYLNVEALTTTLYLIDIELILNDRNCLIEIPKQWLSWKDVRSIVKSPQIKENDPELYSALNEACHHIQTSSTPETNTHRVSQGINLASDWTERVGGHVDCTARRIAIEADGPWHYAANCSHRLGKTLLKHRTLRAFGWDVISVSQKPLCALLISFSMIFLHWSMKSQPISCLLFNFVACRTTNF